MTAPFLRAAPFPWVAVDIAAVSAPRPPRGVPLDRGRLAALVATVREARVGAAWWAPPARGTRLVVRAADRAGAEAGLAAARAAGAAAEATLCLPADEGAGPDGGTVVRGEVDPWSLLGAGTRLACTADDEWRLVAALTGAETIGQATAGAAALWTALVDAVAYRDPFTGEAIEAERAVELLASWRTLLDANRGIAAACGVAWWKARAIERFLWCPRPAALALTDDPVAAVAAAGTSGTVAVWPSRAPAGLADAAATARVGLARIEDGFVRSVGLGSDLHVPRSIVVDRAGIYYDPREPSDLETLLATADFPAPLLGRAAALRAAMVAGGISKYASGAVPAPRPRRDARRTVLVAGQVEDDMSVLAAGGDVGGNRGLLARARAAEPDARLLFRPHPDVDAGHRAGAIPDREALGLADAIVRRAPMAALLAQVDAVHVLTSQTGFEALLRGLEVIVHGRPFYAGWGLTTDLAGPIPRRGRALTLDALVAGTLILYPRYWDPETELPCPPEVLLARFAARPRERRSALILLRQAQGRIARLLRRTTG